MSHLPSFSRFSLLLSLTTLSTASFANVNQIQFAQSMETFCQKNFPAVVTTPFSANGLLTRAASAGQAAQECLTVQTGAMDANYLAQASADELAAMYTDWLHMGRTQVSLVNQHLYNRRSSARSSQQEIQANTADENNPAFSVFLAGARSDGEQSATDYELAYQNQADHFSIGLDWAMTDHGLVGLAFGQADSEIRFQPFQDLTENSSEHLMVYGNWYRDNFAVDTVLGYSRSQFDTQRQMPDRQWATASTDSSTLSFAIAGRYEFSQGGWVYGPKAALEWHRGRIDGFSETDASVWAANVEKQQVKSLVLTMGGHLSHVTHFTWGSLSGYASAELRNEFEDQRQPIAGGFVLDPYSPFSITADKPDTTWAQARVGIQMLHSQGLSVQLGYEQLISYSHTDLVIYSVTTQFEF